MNATGPHAGGLLLNQNRNETQGRTGSKESGAVVNPTISMVQTNADSDAGHSPKSSAVHMAECGFFVFPLRPGSKVPGVKDWERAATCDPEYVAARWPSRATGYGIACGPSGLLVLDLDTRKDDTPSPEAPFDQEGVNEGADAFAVLCLMQGQPLRFDTLQVETGRRGLHLYYRQPEGAHLRNTVGKLGWLIDTRGEGGYVVGPGSTVAGHEYRLLHEEEPAPLPQWIHILLSPPVRPVERGEVIPLRRGDRYALAAVESELERVLSAHPGTRNDTLNRAAFALGQLVAGGQLDEHAIRSMLIDAGQRIGLPYHEAEGTVSSGMRGGAATPRSAA